MPTSKPGRYSGFTLLELMVVMAILAGVTALVMPRFRSQEVTIDQQAFVIANRFKKVRRQALSLGEMREVKFSDVSKSLSKRFQLRLNSDLDNKKTETLIFYPLGNSNGIEWVLKQENLEVTIIVDWLTGETRIKSDQ